MKVFVLLFITLSFSVNADAAKRRKGAERKPANAELRNRMLASKNLEENIQSLTTKSAAETDREKAAAAERFATEQQLVKQEQERRTAVNGQWDQSRVVDGNRTAAERLVSIVRDQEFKRALEKVTPAAKRLWDENQELHSPLTVLATGAAFWAGRTIRLVRKEYLNLTTHVEGRNRSAQFNWSSPIVNGELKFDGNAGNTDMMVGRKISSIDTSSQVHYNFTTQTVKGSIVQPITRDFQFSIQAGQDPFTKKTDTGAQIQFRRDF